VTNKTAATRYARALLDVALQEHLPLEDIEREIASFAELFTTHPTLAKVLLNPAVPVPRKRAAMVDLIGLAHVSSVVGKLLTLLAERDRLVLLPDLVASYRDRLAEHRHVVRAEVTTIAPLASERAEAIQQALARVTGRTVRLTTRVDPAILGGLVARIGSTVYDGSITRQLARMKARMVESA
jgi:F-type H+-transporting ATPase subunit delta